MSLHCNMNTNNNNNSATVSPMHTPRVVCALSSVSVGSISPRLASTTSPSSYSHNPYALNTSKVFHQSFSNNDGLSQQSDSSTFPSPSQGVEFPAVEFDENNLTMTIPQPEPRTPERPMLHQCLNGSVPHCPFPSEAFLPMTTQAPKSGLSRIFVGQLPYNASDMEIAWLFWAFAGVPVFHIERIVQWRKGRQPSGCVHAYVYERDRNAAMTIDQTILFDDCGVWYAETAQQRQHLQEYCHFLADNRESRPFQRPYQMVRVQEAVSTYHPKTEGRLRTADSSSAPASFRGLPDRLVASSRSNSSSLQATW